MFLVEAYHLRRSFADYITCLTSAKDLFFFTMILGDQESRVNQLLYTQATFTLLVLLGLNDEKTSSNVVPMKQA